jgi:hypothetical protein
MNKKSALYVRISPEIDYKLRELIFKKYSKYEKGLLSHEVEEALKNWILLHLQTHTQTQNLKLGVPNAINPTLENTINPSLKVHKVWEQVRDYLLKNYYTELKPSQQISEPHLRQAIKAVRGSDPRTVRKWMKLLEEFKLIKHIVGAIWEIPSY